MLNIFAESIKDPNMVKNMDLVFFSVTREEIINKSYKRLLDTLDVLKKSGKYGRNKLLLNIDGYNNDSREIYMIPEVRDYIQGIWKECKFFLYFVSDLGGTRDVFVACLNGYISHKYVGMKETILEVNYNKFVMQETVDAIIRYGMQVNDYDEAFKIAKKLVS